MFSSLALRPEIKNQYRFTMMINKNFYRFFRMVANFF